MSRTPPEYEKLRNCIAFAFIKEPGSQNNYYPTRIKIENGKITQITRKDAEPLGYAVITLKQELEDEAALLYS